MRDATFRSNQRSRWLRWFFPLVGICWGLISADRVQAYDNDVHYVFTYYLARKLGYTRTQAHQVASADVSVDQDEHTEPLQKKAVGSLHESAQPPRIKFHAFRDSRLIEKIIANETAQGKSWADAQATAIEYAEKAKQKQLEYLYQQALVTGNVGMYLHALQDVEPHSGFSSFDGHFFKAHARDFLSLDEAKAVKMTRATINALRSFLRDYFKQEPAVLDSHEVTLMLRELQRVNPVEGHGQESPSEDRARAVVEKFLGEALPRRIDYHFDKDGRPLDAAGYALPPPADEVARLVQRLQEEASYFGRMAFELRNKREALLKALDSPAGAPGRSDESLRNGEASLAALNQRIDALSRGLARAVEACTEIQGMTASLERKVKSAEKDEPDVEAMLLDAQRTVGGCRDPRAITEGDNHFTAAQQRVQKIKRDVETLSFTRERLRQAARDLQPYLGQPTARSNDFGSGPPLYEADFGRFSAGRAAPSNLFEKVQFALYETEGYARQAKAAAARMNSADPSFPNKVAGLNKEIEEGQGLLGRHLSALHNDFSLAARARVVERLQQLQKTLDPVEPIRAYEWKDRWPAPGLDGSLRVRTERLLKGVAEAKQNLDMSLRRVGNCPDGGAGHLRAAEALMERLDTAQFLANKALQTLGAGYQQKRKTCLTHLERARAPQNRPLRPPAYLVRFWPKENPRDIRWMLYGTPPKDGWIHFGDGTGGMYHYPAESLGYFRDEAGLCAALSRYQVYSVSYPGYTGTVSCPRGGSSSSR